MNTIKRYYGDNGQLLRYTIAPTAHHRNAINKEMTTRALRYKKQSDRAHIIDAVAPYAVIVAGISFLVVWYLINN